MFRLSGKALYQNLLNTLCHKTCKTAN